MINKKRRFRKLMIIFICILILLFGIVEGRTLYLTTATKGEPFTDYDNGKAALLVIDLQKDTMNIPQYSNSKALLQNINNAVEYASQHDIEVIYIKEEYSNPIDLILSGGRYKANSTGSALSEQLSIKSNNIFTKLKADAFSKKDFEQSLIDKQIDTLYLVGADASACVYRTALGGINRGYQVTILKDCTFSVSEKYLNKMLNQYEKAGILTDTLSSFMK